MNRGMAFTEEERDRFALRGLLPPRVLDINMQETRVLENLRRKDTDLEKYLFLMGLQDRNTALFYRVLVRNIEELMPIVYTPTVGLACQLYGHIFRRPRGLYVSINDAGHVREILQNWPERDVRVIVVTDGERILGLGDLGTHGMGIPVGKLNLYSACGGVDPRHCLPVTIDVGTNNTKYLDDPLYTGLVQQRVRGEAYDALIDEFMRAVRQSYRHTLVQFEDFGNSNAFRLLEKYRHHFCTFNDDIQGTASVALAGVLAGLKIAKKKISELTFLFLGAGEAGIGIGELIASAIESEGVSHEEAIKKCWFIDSKGLITSARGNLQEHKKRFAHDHDSAPQDLLEIVRDIKPNVLIGVSAQPGVFTRDVVQLMAELNEHPFIFPLSNPTSKAECTAEQGRCIFCSGSPFGPVHLGNQTFYPGQGNNAYIFPGVGLGAIAAEAEQVTDEMFTAAAHKLASMVTDEDLANGTIYPSLTRIREVSVEIACGVANMVFDLGLTRLSKPDDVRALVLENVYDPAYSSHAAARL